MKRNLLIATTAAALIASAGLSYAQAPNAPQGSTQKTESDVKMAPHAGDSGKIGATPNADRSAMEHQKGSRSLNGAKAGSPAQSADTKKQAVDVGDPSKVGATPSGNASAMERQNKGAKMQKSTPVGSSAQKANRTKQDARTGDTETQSGSMKTKGKM